MYFPLQIIRWVRRLHTLPNHKVRFKPFFQKIKYQDQLTDVCYTHVHVCDNLSLGDLEYNKDMQHYSELENKVHSSWNLKIKI